MLFFRMNTWFLGLFGACLAIASGGDDSIVRIWDAATSHTELVYRGHTAPILKVAWSPDSKEIASSDLNGAIQVWQPGL